MGTISRDRGSMQEAKCQTAKGYFWHVVSHIKAALK